MKSPVIRVVSVVLFIILVLSGCSVQPSHFSVQSPRAQLTVDPAAPLAISDHLFGLFLEDINFSVDAGLYAELVRNRSFEYGAMAAGGAKHSWSITSQDVTWQVVNDGTGLNENNPSYAVLNNASSAPQGLSNTGYLDGLAVTAGSAYHASLFLRGNAQVTLSLEDSSGTAYAQAVLDADGDAWRKYTAVLTPTETVSKNLRFAVRIGQGTIQMDMVSLIPQDTFAGLPIRKDLGEALAALHPSFLRFPGGCVIEGKSPESMYRWKDSVGNGISFTVNGQSAVGDPAVRKQTTDLWRGNAQNPYYCTYGLGFYEYFCLCEALDCFAVPVVNAGMTCPSQSANYLVYPTGSPEFQQCIQDALDLAEFCRGGADTSWGAVRIAMGHPEPFQLRYIGIGNEQWQSEYHRHYELFVEAFENAARIDPQLYGGIELIVANGPLSSSAEGWGYVDDCPDSLTTLVDEHYYEPAQWFFTNTQRYYRYSRDSQAKVFLGEYAAQANTLYAALAEAAYMTALERNGDVVDLACYAPLFGNATLNQWTPDMMFFSKDSLCLTPNYYVQQMFAANAGDTYLSTQLDYTGLSSESSLSGRVGLGSWMTQVAYDDLAVTSNETGATLYSNDFSKDSLDDFDLHEGDWAIQDGRLVQSFSGAPADQRTGDALYLGQTDWTDYTLTVKGEILGGSEGFLIPICVENSANQIFWNLGGWGNTVSCLQIVTNGSKSGQISGTTRPVSLKKGQTYEIQVEVSGSHVRCYLDGVLYIDYTQQTPQPLYASTVQDETGAWIIKLVNSTGGAIPVDLALPGIQNASAEITVLHADSPDVSNSFGDLTAVVPEVSTGALSNGSTYEAPAYSLTVLRIGK